MIPPLSRLALESREVPAVLERQGIALARPIADLIAAIRAKCPLVVVTCARGSSAHAATFAKHLFERYLGLPVSAAAPNVASVYRQPLHLAGQLFVAISQSGRSADLVETAEMARSSRALTVAIVNDVASDLAKTCEFVLPMEAGPELSVAASKSFIASLAVLLRFAAAWAGEAQMQNAIERLPERLTKAAELDWSAAIPVLSEANSVVTIGRGPTLAIAREAALKLKEGCSLHAEAFSSAEFQHGPISLVEQDYPVFAFAPNDASADGVATLLGSLQRKGAVVIGTGLAQIGSGSLPALTPQQPEADAICLIQTFYQLLSLLAAHRGNDIDRPRHLQKVTLTR
jgi:glucosamine--fructose-6-phosphate aminotransferase (isomerizing)